MTGGGGNRIAELFKKKKTNLLSVYFTAGFPARDDTSLILKAVQEGGADIAEIGMPFSDPVADGPTIQAANERALQNGMSLDLLFKQLKDMRPAVEIPVVLMGYLNPILQFGPEKFCERCRAAGVDGVILPDLPPELYLKSYKDLFERYGILAVFLVTPQSTDERIRWIDSISSGFIYAVSSAAVTGGSISFDDARTDYLRRLAGLKLRHPVLIGFGVSTRDDCVELGKYSEGVIIGSAFLRALSQGGDARKAAYEFVKGVKL